MPSLLLLFSIIAQVSQQVCRKEFNKKSNDQPLSFSLLGVLASLVYFLVLSCKETGFEGEALLYVIPFSLCYTAAYVFTFFAIKHGPLSLTSLMISCSVVVPLLYGVVFLKEPVGFTLAVGFVLLLLSMLFVSEPWKTKNVTISLKWIIYISITFFANGICMTIQKLFQLKDQGEHSNKFMLCSLAITFLCLLLFYLFGERGGIRKVIKARCAIWPVVCGIGNGVANQLTMILAIILPASFLYPVQSAGAIILTAIVSVLLYKEKLSFFQKIGFVSGVLAIIAFNV